MVRPLARRASCANIDGDDGASSQIDGADGRARAGLVRAIELRTVTRGTVANAVASIGLDDCSSERILRWHRVSDEVRKQLAETNLALVLAMAKRVRSADLDFGDLMSEGNMALMRSVDKFDFSRGFKFSTYACRAILKAYSRLGLKAQKYRKHFPVEFDPALERGDHVGAVRAARQTEDVAEVKTLFDSNRAGLSELERTVIFHRYGLDRPVHAAPMTLEKVGVMVGVTKERVRQIQNKALEKIRRALVCLNPAAAERLPTINGSRN